MPTQPAEITKIKFQDFEAQLRAQGFDAVLEREYRPLEVIDTHVHAFAAKALVVRGVMSQSSGLPGRLERNDTQRDEPQSL